jgi:hypothetical protein
VCGVRLVMATQGICCVDLRGLQSMQGGKKADYTPGPAVWIGFEGPGGRAAHHNNWGSGDGVSKRKSEHWTSLWTLDK